MRECVRQKCRCSAVELLVHVDVAALKAVAPPFPPSPARHSSDRVNQLEALVETYKRKLEDLGDLRRQVRLLEERNTVYMQRTCELEEELRRANAVRGHLDTYKRQVGRERCEG